MFRAIEIKIEQEKIAEISKKKNFKMHQAKMMTMTKNSYLTLKNLPYVQTP